MWRVVWIFSFTLCGEYFEFSPSLYVESSLDFLLQLYMGNSLDFTKSATKIILIAKKKL